MLVHTLDQPEVAKGQGPVALVLAPTRELAEQIHKEARRFAKAYDLRVAAAFGGLSKFDQVKELKAGSEVLVVRPPSEGEASTTAAAVTCTAVVGRAKVERRPMTRVDVRLADGSTCSAVLQNAETVRVVAPRSSSPKRRASSASSLPSS